jgi:hypothetical protein
MAGIEGLFVLQIFIIENKSKIVNKNFLGVNMIFSGHFKTF